MFRLTPDVSPIQIEGDELSITVDGSKLTVAIIQQTKLLAHRTVLIDQDRPCTVAIAGISIVVPVEVS